MGVAIGFAWFFGSVYALVSLLRLLPPFQKRSQAGLAFGGIQIAAIAAAAAVGVGADQPRIAVEAEAHLPESATASDKSGDLPYLVRIKPGEKLAEPATARPADLASLREKTRRALKTLDAAEVVLTNAVQNGRLDLVRDAQSAAQKVSFGMVQDRELLMGTGEMDKLAPCERAASNLASVARSVATGGQGTEAVQTRLRLMGRYQEERQRCEAWLAG